MADRLEDAQWFLQPDVEVRNLIVGDYVLDVVVAHGIGDWMMTEADRPVVSEILRIERTDGTPFIEDIQLDMRAVAIDAAIKASPRVMHREPHSGGHRFVAYTSGERWRTNASLVRFAASEFGRTRWSPEMNRWLIDTWKQISEDSSATLSDLASELGITPNRLTAHLADLRKLHGADVVPKGRPGRKSSNPSSRASKEES